tara:strand:- start:19998 stop:20732 length:735 start_codon:yes stop_codon:yes gene_type:complete
MPILMGAHILLALCCAVHALRSGRQMYWLFILFAFPMFGSAVYIIAEVLPEMAGSQGARKAGRAARQALDPTREVRAALDQLEITRTPGNLKRAAEALLETDRPDEALQLMGEASSGAFAEDPAMMFALARCQFANQLYPQALDQLDRLRLAHPQQRLPDGHLLYARTLEAAGRQDEALDAYASVSEYYPGPEARARWALLLEQAGQSDAARQRWAEITLNARHAPKFARRVNRKWIDMARSRV